MKALRAQERTWERQLCFLPDRCNTANLDDGSRGVCVIPGAMAEAQAEQDVSNAEEARMLGVVQALEQKLAAVVDRASAAGGGEGAAFQAWFSSEF